MSTHTKAWERIPWLVNGSLQGEPLNELQQHLSTCDECRAELALQRRLRDAIAAQPTVEFAPQASFNSLWARIEADTEFQKPIASVIPPRPRRWHLYGLAAQWLLIAGMAWWYIQAGSADYRTVTSRSFTPVGELAGEFKVVFDDSTTLAQVKDMLAGTGLTSISGPTPAGVFVLSRDAQHDDLDLDATLAQLRANPHVRFAERSAGAE